MTFHKRASVLQGARTRGRWLFRGSGGTRLKSLSFSVLLTSSLFRCAISVLVYLTNEPTGTARASARTPFGGSALRFSLGRVTEKQDGDLWDGAGRRRHPFNGLPKRLNFVADPLLSAPGDPGGCRASTSTEVPSPGGYCRRKPGFLLRRPSASFSSITK